jgi:hypothetical protein
MGERGFLVRVSPLSKPGSTSSVQAGIDVDRVEQGGQSPFAASGTRLPFVRLLPESMPHTVWVKGLPGFSESWRTGLSRSPVR